MSMSMADFHNIITNSRDLQSFDNRLWKPGSILAAHAVANRVIRALEERYCRYWGRFSGRAVLTGSRARGVALDTPSMSDIDILFLIQRDYRIYRSGVPIQSFEEFENIRVSAFDNVKGFLYDELPYRFYHAKVVEESCYPGFVIKLEVKLNQEWGTLWKVEIGFALDYEYSNNLNWQEIGNKLHALGSKALAQSNSFAPMRNSFLNRMYDHSPALQMVVRILKAWYRILTKDDDPNKIISGFMFEMLVLLLFSNNYMPFIFDTGRVIATCLMAIAKPYRVPNLLFGEFFRDDDFDRPLPDYNRPNQVSLVLIDPFLTFNNVAWRKMKEREAWPKLERAAQETVDFMRSKGVIPYAFGWPNVEFFKLVKSY